MTLGDRLTRSASERPRSTALIFEGKKLTYRELDRMTDGFAAALASAGVRPGETVALLLPNSIAFAVAYFGIVKAGAAAVPLNTFLTVPELEFIISDSKSRMLVSSHDFAEKARALAERPGLLERVIYEGGAGSAAAPFSDFIIKGGKGPGAPDDSEPAAVLYTSGTTGRPKGAVLTHINLLSNAAACAEKFKITKKDRVLLFLPMFHAFSFLVCMLLPVSVGARVIILPSVRPFSKVIRGVTLGRATLFVAIPAVYNLLSQKKFPKLLLRLLAVRLCVSGAAPLPGEVLERFKANFPFPLLEGYGLTEASPVVSCNPLNGTRKPGSVGLPLPGVDVKVVGEDESELPPDNVGEIIVKGPNVMKGYLGNEQATAETVRGGWLFTGDMGYKDDDGYIYIVDRKKDLILVHGMNVYPREVEEVIYSHPSVKDAAVIGVKAPGFGEMVKAVVCLKDGATLTEKALKGYLKERLAAYKLPRQVEFVESLPMTPTGKVLKRKLTESAGV